MSYLECINSSEDIRKLSFSELEELAEEIRSFLIANVSKTGGHLASNLGVVEITIAIQNVFDTSKDRVLFDVGHQSYVHKLLTGRGSGFERLRQFGGMSGFPKPSESVHDAFTAGHASSAVSTALGMARARSLQGEDYSVIAVVGDGATTGGLFFEGMNDAGASNEPLIVILNDNGMSISKNVGSLARHFSRLRLKPGYFGLKKAFRRFTKKVPGGAHIYQAAHDFKNWVHRVLLGSTIFEEMGFVYYGPVDGHDIEKMSYLLQRAKEERKPVLIHAITKKGKGYLPAEQHPGVFHGIGRFDPKDGTTPEPKKTFSACFAESLVEIASVNEKVCAITAGMTEGTALTEFASRFPERFFDVGIAEEHAVSMAGGLAKQGMIPVFAVYSTFLQRAYDMLLQDIALQHLHAVFCVDRAGLVGEDGETHQGVFDVGFLKQIPGMEIYSPCNYVELREVIRYAVEKAEGPVAVRYPRGCETEEYEICSDDSSSPAEITLAGYGTTMYDLYAAKRELSARGVAADVVQIRCLKPLNLTEIVESCRVTGRLIIVEEQTSSSCIGTDIMTGVLKAHPGISVRLLNAGDRFIQNGSIADLKKYLGIDRESILKNAEELLALEK